MVDQLLEDILKKLENHYYKEISKKKSCIVSIYLYSSYVREDFVPGRSDLDFAVFLDLPDEF